MELLGLAAMTLGTDGYKNSTNMELMRLGMAYVGSL